MMFRDRRPADFSRPELHKVNEGRMQKEHETKEWNGLEGGKEMVQTNGWNTQSAGNPNYI